MDRFNDIIIKIINKQFISSILIVIISISLYKIIAHILSKEEKNTQAKLFAGKRSKTYLRLLRSIIRYIFLITTVLVLMKINGIDVSSVLTGVGILGVVFGLAIQDWLKDIIRGSSLISDNYFSVGDIVKYNDVEGKVLVIGLKSTKIKDLKTGNIKTIANRNIEEIDVVSNIIYVDVPLSYELPIKKAENIIKHIIIEIKKSNNVEDSTYVGIENFESSYINYHIKIECNPLFKLQVRRDALSTILRTMEKEGVVVPYTQIDIHSK